MGMTTTLAIDMGNTRIKAGIFRNSHLVEHMEHPSEQWDEFLLLLSKLTFDRGILIGTSRFEQAFASELTRTTPTLFWQKWNDCALPFKTTYQTPETLGKDRLAAVAGARKRYPDINLMVINFGTCTTYDLVINDIHQGGAISPGVGLRLRAMHEFTGKLPLLTISEKVPEFPGQTTGDSMSIGAIRGLAAEANDFFDDINRSYPNVNVVITGGEAETVAPLLKCPIFAHPFLTLEGLNEILLFQH